MPAPESPDVTAVLAEVQAGAPGAVDRLATLVMDELRRIAEVAMHREDDGHTLQPTELVDEAFMRLLGQRRVQWMNRAQFFAVAAQTIRRLLVDHARARRRMKRDHGVRVTLDDALQQLDTLAPRQARVVELRFFGGLEVHEAAEALGVSAATVKRDWTFARAFLLRALDGGGGALHPA